MKKPNCTGCNNIKGVPFWGTCKTYACAESHEVEHCGVCREFPCRHIVEQYDPSHLDGQKDAICRTGFLAFRKRHGDDALLELMQKVQKKN